MGVSAWETAARQHQSRKRGANQLLPILHPPRSLFLAQPETPESFLSFSAPYVRKREFVVVHISYVVARAERIRPLFQADRLLDRFDQLLDSGAQVPAHLFDEFRFAHPGTKLLMAMLAIKCCKLAILQQGVHLGDRMPRVLLILHDV